MAQVNNTPSVDARERGVSGYETTTKSVRTICGRKQGSGQQRRSRDKVNTYKL
jgi:hypothetical protein